MPAVQIDPEKIKPHFEKKMEERMSDEITTNFMSFATHTFTQSKLFRDHTANYDED